VTRRQGGSEGEGGTARSNAVSSAANYANPQGRWSIRPCEFARSRTLDKFSILWVGFNARKDSIPITTAAAGREGEVHHVRSVGGDLVSPNKAVRALAFDTSVRTGRMECKGTALPQPFPAPFTGNNRCTNGCSTFFSVPIAKKCSSTPSHDPKRLTS
jgi:hypothetical protein